jgi:hypothetical protein
MSEEGPSKSAFSTEYREILRERDEPDTSWAGDAMKPVAIFEHEGGFGLFRPWQNPDAGDKPLAVFTELADARLAAVAHSVIRRTQHYQLREPRSSRVADGYAVFRSGDSSGWLQGFDPDWIVVMNVLTWIAQWAEGLAVMLDLAGPTIQVELGEILGRGYQVLPRPGAAAEPTRPEPVQPVPPAAKGEEST